MQVKGLHSGIAGQGDIFDPFSAPLPPDLLLENAPIQSVIAQVKFPTIFGFSNESRIASFQEEIRKIYPIPVKEDGNAIKIGQNIQINQALTWRFSSADNHWRVSLSSDFMALETSNYADRAEFLRRLRDAISAVENYFKPTHFTRFGIRYINRIDDEKIIEAVEDFVKPQMLGISSFLPKTLIQEQFNVCVLKSGDDKLAIRWGKMPKNSTFDPTAIAPIAKDSWILDMDMFNENVKEFACDGLCATAKSYAERIYTFFRWAVDVDKLQSLERIK